MINIFGFTSRLKGDRNITAALKQSFFHAWEALREIGGESGAESYRMAGLAIVRRLLDDGAGNIDPRKLELFRHLLESEHFTADGAGALDDLLRAKPMEVETAAEALLVLPPESRLKLIRFLLTLASAADCPAADFNMLGRLSGMLEIAPELFQQLRQEVKEDDRRRRRIISSGAGIIAAVVVVLVFILTATLLRSVIFGLIIAYLLLPVEKYFERRLRAGRGLGCHFFNFIAFCYSPLVELSRYIMLRSGRGRTLSAEQRKLRIERGFIHRAMVQTMLLLLLLFTAVMMLFSMWTEPYVDNIGNSIRQWQHDQRAAMTVAAADGQNMPEKSAAAKPSGGKSGIEFQVDRVFSRGEEYLNRMQQRFERLPLVQMLLQQMKVVLEDPRTQREAVSFILKRSGGLFSFTAGVVGMAAAVVCDLLLTIFFALLFLAKLAEFCRDDDSRGRKSEYLVRSVFNGKWLPRANDSTIQEARRIVGGILDRLRIWVRGYLTLVLVDSSVYITVFYFLKVPYFPILGFIAGCGILLPYIGPIISAAVTVLVTLAVGGTTGAQIAGIITAYLIYNGIIEQFILYPAVIGESLGLTALETIIVVLLGAIFAGIPGMLFALPATSVLKYLIPQFYRSWNLFKS